MVWEMEECFPHANCFCLRVNTYLAQVLFLDFSLIKTLDCKLLLGDSMYGPSYSGKCAGPKSFAQQVVPDFLPPLQ